MRSIATLRLYPGRIVGMHIGWNEAFMKWFKEAVPMRMWDPTSKTWWFPIDSLPLVENQGAAMGVFTRDDLDKFAKAVPTALTPSTADDERAFAFRKLHLTPDAPPRLIELAYRHQRGVLERAGGTLVEQHTLNEAFRVLGGTP